MVKSLSSKEVATSTVSLCKYGGRLHKHQFDVSNAIDFIWALYLGMFKCRQI